MTRNVAGATAVTGGAESPSQAAGTMTAIAARPLATGLAGRGGSLRTVEPFGFRHEEQRRDRGERERAARTGPGPHERTGQRGDPAGQHEQAGDDDERDGERDGQVDDPNGREQGAEDEVD